MERFVDVSFVIPVFNNGPSIEELYQRIHKSLEDHSLTYDIFFIDDGSQDNSWENISKLCQQHPNITGIQLSRNFGQHVAVKVGQDHCKGSSVAIMDCDLQDRPEHIVELHDKLKEGFDIVFTKRKKRQHFFVFLLNPYLLLYIKVFFASSLIKILISNMVAKFYSQKK